MIVKICGITTVEDARRTLEAGADWIGLNLFAGPRRIGISRASEILGDLDDPSRAVALVSVDDRDTLERLPRLRSQGVRRLQLYGHPKPSTLESLRRDDFELLLPWPVPSAFEDTGQIESWRRDLEVFLADCGDMPPDYLLLDTKAEDRHGGTGRQADWDAIGSAWTAESTLQGRPVRPPVILAGGLSPDNVAEAISLVRPAGVDVSSGVESAPGRKDHAAVTAFVDAARRAGECR